MSCQSFQSCFRIFVWLVVVGFFVCFVVSVLFVCLGVLLFGWFVCFIGNFSSIFSECSLDFAALAPYFKSELQHGEYFHILALKSWMEQRISYNAGAFQLFALR